MAKKVNPVPAIPSRNWRASHKFAPIAPRKARLIVDLIRGRSCAEALEQLQFNGQRASALIRNVLRSAMASADEAEADTRRLYIADARVDGGPYVRRWRPKDRGRAHPIAKRMSHIRIAVAEAE
jgi:large subunit ribosomal protein L22